MEREILFTGIGGQGVQLASKVLALAATREERNVLSLGTYGGTMRGGNTDSTVVVADEPVVSPPIVSRAWGGLILHPRYFAPVRKRLRPGGALVFEASLAAELDAPGLRTAGVDGVRLAREVEAPMAGGLALLGAFCGWTALVSARALVEAMHEALPPYRAEHAAANARAIEAGFAALPAGEAPAWVPDVEAA